MNDFHVSHHGSVSIVTALTNEAVDWVDENVSQERVNFAGGFGVESRYVDDLLTGIEAAGFSIRVI